MTDSKPGRMDVQRIETEHGGHIEPPPDKAWDDLTKLKWWAGVANADTGLDIGVKVSDFRVNDVPQDGYYDIVISGVTAIGPCLYQRANSVMTGISIGYRAAKREGDTQ